MNRTIVIVGDIQKQNAISVLREIPLEPVHEVIIQEHKTTRSLAQNRLLHKWFGEISAEQGILPDEVKFTYKKRFLIDIFSRRDDGVYLQTLEALRKLYKDGYKDDSLFLHRQIVNKTSTSDANVKEMTEFLNYIEIDAAQQGIVLTRPDDYSVALGIKEGK